MEKMVFLYLSRNICFPTGKSCSLNNGGCSHVCVDEAWGALCVCPVGYRLSPSGVVCEGVWHVIDTPSNTGCRSFLISGFAGKFRWMYRRRRCIQILNVLFVFRCRWMCTAFCSLHASLHQHGWVILLSLQRGIPTRRKLHMCSYR